MLARILFGRTFTMLDLIVLITVTSKISNFWVSLILWSLWIAIVGPALSRFFLPQGINLKKPETTNSSGPQ